MTAAAGSSTTIPVGRLAARMAARIAAAGGSRRELDRDHVGELTRAVAWSWIEETGRLEASPAEWLPRVCRALTACGASETAALLMLFDTQLVRPATWTFHGRRPFWILDCDRLALDESETTPLLLNRGLAVILNRMAPLWDRGSGIGALGLRHGDRLAPALAAGGQGGNFVLRQALRELRRHCVDRLTLLGRRRGWVGSPEVVLL